MQVVRYLVELSQTKVVMSQTKNSNKDSLKHYVGNNDSEFYDCICTVFPKYTIAKSVCEFFVLKKLHLNLHGNMCHFKCMSTGINDSIRDIIDKKKNTNNNNPPTSSSSTISNDNDVIMNKNDPQTSSNDNDITMNGNDRNNHPHVLDAEQKESIVFNNDQILANRQMLIDFVSNAQSAHFLHKIAAALCPLCLFEYEPNQYNKILQAINDENIEAATALFDKRHPLYKVMK